MYTFLSLVFTAVTKFWGQVFCREWRFIDLGYEKSRKSKDTVPAFVQRVVRAFLPFHCVVESIKANQSKPEGTAFITNSHKNLLINS